MSKTKQQKTDIRPYTRQFYKGNVGLFLISLTNPFLNVAFNLIISWLLQQVLDLIGGESILFTLKELILIGLCAVIGIIICGVIDYHAKSRFITRGISQYKTYVFGELTKKNISAFSRENSSTYISALTNDIQAIEKGFLENIFTIVAQSMFFIGAFAMMIWYSPLLTLTAVCFTLFPLVVSIFVGDKMASAEKAVSVKNESYTSSLKDALSGFAVVKSFKAEAQMIRIFKDNVKKLKNAQCKKHKISAFIETCGVAAGVIAQLGVFVIGAYLSISGQGVTAGTIIVFVQLMNYVVNPIGVLPTCFAETKSAKALLEKIANSLQENIREEGKVESNTERKTLTNGIRIQNLSFGYTAEKQVLQNVAYTFSLGKKYAIVGASGSGKSTLLNLLMSAHQNYTGEIFYDENELKDLPFENLYEIVSIIQQNVFIFNATIRENISMFSEFPNEDIERAIQLSGLSTLLKDKGEDYLCGENGSALSGGEKQRVSIARSLLKKSQVLLVDEATSALDLETAYQVSESILGLNDITAIVVTHSLDERLLKQYDGILTLKNGQIIETGTFDELIAQKGYFYSLFTISQ